VDRKHHCLLLLTLISLILAAPTCRPASSTPEPTKADDRTEMDEESGGEPAGAGGPLSLGDLKEELFYGGHGGSVPVCLVELYPLSGIEKLPAVKGTGRSLDEGALCVLGFPLDEEITVDLYGPDDNPVSSKEFPVPTVDGWYAGEEGGVTFREITLGWPAGLPTGQWYAVVESANAHAEGPFTVEPHDGPAVSTVPDPDLNPFESYSCGSYLPDEQVYVLGTSFEPNADLPLGIYLETQETKPDDDGSLGWVSVLVDSKMVTSDGRGDFSTSILVKSSYSAGLYYVVVVTNPDGGHIDFAGPNNCFRVP
jgi:hypothetical protein